MKNKNISIIIPYFNSEKYIAECLSSVLESVFPEDEILIINDGSSKESKRLVEELTKGTSVKVIDQINSGPNVARNTGMEHCTGEYIIFLDADDIIEKKAISSIKKNITEAQADVYVYGVEFFDECNYKRRTLIRPSDRYAVGNQAVKEGILARDFLGVCWNKVYDKKFLVKNGIKFYCDKGHGRDVLFTKEVALNVGSILFVSEIICKSRCRDGSYSRDFGLKNVVSAIELVQMVASLKIKYNANPEICTWLDFSARKHLRYVLLLAGFRLNTYDEFKSACREIKVSLASNLWPKLSFVDFKRSRSAREIAILLPFLNLDFVWIVSRVAKIFKVRPY